MPTPLYLDNDGHYSILPDPRHWQLFPHDPLPAPPRIRIQFNKYLDYGKGFSVGDAAEDDTDDDDEENISPSPLSPTNLPHVREPLQLISTNFRSSYVRKAAPRDVHMVRIFKALGWMVVEQDVDESLVKLETEREKRARRITSTK